LLEWLTPDFDGVILFDEAHAMGGVAGGEGGSVPPRARSKASSASNCRTACRAPA
jgi:hypothetical protein